MPEWEPQLPGSHSHFWAPPAGVQAPPRPEPAQGARAPPTEAVVLTESRLGAGPKFSLSEESGPRKLPLPHFPPPSRTFWLWGGGFPLPRGG